MLETVIVNAPTGLTTYREVAANAAIAARLCHEVAALQVIQAVNALSSSAGGWVSHFRA